MGTDFKVGSDSFLTERVYGPIQRFHRGTFGIDL